MSRGYRKSSYVAQRIGITLFVLCVLSGIVLALLMMNIEINEDNLKILRIPFTDRVIALESPAPAVAEDPAPEDDPVEEGFLPAEGTSYQERIERSVVLPHHMMFDTAKVDDFLKRLSGTNVNTVIIEAKPANGALAFVSSSPLAGEASAEKNDALLALKAKIQQAGYAVVASVSCFRDNLIPRNNEALGCKNRDGALWGDAMRYTWLDPYSEDAHVYLITLISDLYKLGFTEILLTNLSFPIAADADLIVYDPGRETVEEKEQRLDQFLLQLGGFANGLPDLSLSVRFEGAEGQNMQTFANFFYRIYLPLTNGEETAVHTDPIIEMSAFLGEGTLPYRLVPLISLAERPALEAYEMVKEMKPFGTGYLFDSADGVYDPVLFQTKE